MRAQDIIQKKRDGHALAKGEIDFLIDGALNSTIPKYQISAFLMAVYFSGMDSKETSYLTSALIESGETISLNQEHAPYVDKHSTGGVGDGTSLVIAPILAACGLYVPMISGRALGHTGGTLDKLDSIPHYQTQLSKVQFVNIIEKCGYAMCGQTQDLAPADKYLYELRDVTSTVESIPLITSSILSKKFAEGTDVLVLDVKCGRGAFARDITFARALARQLLETGTHLEKDVRVIITNMNQPLGIMIGNFLEVEQAAAVLCGYKDPLYSSDHLQDFIDITMHLTARIIIAARKTTDMQSAMRLIQDTLDNGSAWEHFCRNVSLQGGDIDHFQRMLGDRRAKYQHTVLAKKTGYISSLNAYSFGIAAATLGVGRLTVESEIDYEAGIQLCKKEGDRARVGEPLCILYSNDASSLENAERILYQSGIEISDTAPDSQKELILEVIEQ